MDLAVDEALADSVQLHSALVTVAIVVATTELAGAAELVAGAAEETWAAELAGAGAAEETGAAELAGTGAADELEPPAASAAQAAWPAARVAVNISLVNVR